MKNKNKNIVLTILCICLILSGLPVSAHYPNPKEVGTITLSSILPQNISPYEVASCELVEMGDACTIYKIETKDGRVFYQVVAMVALNALPKGVKYACLAAIKNQLVCEWVKLAAESIIDLFASSIVEQVDKFFTTRIEGNQGQSSIYAVNMDEAKEGKMAYEASKAQANFPWQPAVIREYEDMGESYAKKHMKIGDILTEFKVKIGDRADKLFLPENLDREQLTKIRSLYRIDNQETVIGALSDVTWAGSWFYDQFDEGIVFTNEQIYIRHGSNTVGALPYQYINDQCEVQYNDSHVVVYSKKDQKRWDASVADSELEPIEVSKLINDIAQQVSSVNTIKPKKSEEPIPAPKELGEPQTEPSVVPVTTTKSPSKNKPSSASSLNQAATYYRNKQYQQAFDLLYQNRNSKSMTGELYYLLGRMYFDGNGVSVNKAEAFKYISKSADNGYPDGLFLRGDMNSNGIGTSKNLTAAAEDYRKAAERGNKEAMFKIGQCYETGSGVAKKESTAKLWYKKAMDLGHAEAGRRYSNLN
jgi:Sel1 repeat